MSIYALQITKGSKVDTKTSSSTFEISSQLDQLFRNKTKRLIDAITSNNGYRWDNRLMILSHSKDYTRIKTIFFPIVLFR